MVVTCFTVLTVCHELLSSSPLVPYQKLDNENSAIALSNKRALNSLDEPSPHTHEQSHVTHSHNNCLSDLFLHWRACNENTTGQLLVFIWTTPHTDERHMVQTIITFWPIQLFCTQAIFEVRWEWMAMTIPLDSDITCLFLDELHHTQMYGHMLVTEITTSVYWPLFILLLLYQSLEVQQ